MLGEVTVELVGFFLLQLRFLKGSGLELVVVLLIERSASGKHCVHCILYMAFWLNRRSFKLFGGGTGHKVIQRVLAFRLLMTRVLY